MAPTAPAVTSTVVETTVDVTLTAASTTEITAQPDSITARASIPGIQYSLMKGTFRWETE